jgi:hypothetical protein
MKKLHVILFVIAVFVSIGAFLWERRAATNVLHIGVYQSQYYELDDLAEFLLRTLQQNDTMALKSFLPTAGEFINIEKYLADPGQNPDAGRAIAFLMISENYKSMMRWMSVAKQYRSWTDPRISEPDSIEFRNGLEVLRGMQFSAVDSLGNRLQIPMFKTLLHTNDGYKIYTLLEPVND